MKPKTAYIIPGYGENVHRGGYLTIRSFFEQHHINVVPVDIHWEYRTFSSYLAQLLNSIRPDEKQPILFGFSFGAVVAFLAAQQLNPEKLYLCSLSPYFKEDLAAANYQTLRSLGKRRTREMLKVSFTERAREITSSTVLVAGSEEDPAVIKRTHEAAHLISGSTLSIAEGASHSMNDCCYLDTLKQLIVC